MYSTTWIAAAVRSVLTPARSALAYAMRVICACRRSRSAKVHRVAAGQRAIKQQQQQRASLLAQLKAQEEAIAAAARKLRETRDSLNQLNKQIEMNAALAKLERQRVSGAEPRRAARCRSAEAAYRHPDGAQR